MSKWKLAADSFSKLDRKRISRFILDPYNQLTMGPKTIEFEGLMSDYARCLALGVSSGSAANHLVFELYKQKNPEKFKNTLVICPVVTWISNISPAIMAGYEIKFCDINLDDFSFDYVQLEKILEENKDKNLIIWTTALIGHCPDFDKLKNLASKYGAELWTDACEANFCTYRNQSILSLTRFTTLSCYFSHCITAIEFGFIFFQNREDYDFAKLLRNHGMIRSIEPDNPYRQEIESKYNNIDKQFLFAAMGTNWRPSDMHAVWGIEDMKRALEYKRNRVNLYKLYCKKIDKEKYYIPNYSELCKDRENVAFCLPIFRKDDKLKELKELLTKENIETRPIIGSCLTLQPVFEKYHDETLFPNAIWLHNHGLYVGLHNRIGKIMMGRLINILNNL